MFTLSTNHIVTARRSSVSALKMVASKSFVTLSIQQRQACVYRIYDGNGVAQHELIAVARQQHNGGLDWRPASDRERGQPLDKLPPALGHGGIDVNRSFDQVFG